MNPMLHKLRSLSRRLRTHFVIETLEPFVYLLVAAFATLVAARGYFDARNLQLSWANAARLGAPASAGLGTLAEVTWSAPLDDTFIHFDFAQAFARLKPFEWSPGGGYSSGATSWLYPAFLALGIPLGFTGQRLGEFSDVLACVCILAFFVSSRALFGRLPALASYLLIPAVLTSGVLCWSLFSGMELCLFLALWSLCARYFLRINAPGPRDNPTYLRRSLAVAGLLLVMTRPEALYCVVLFAWLLRPPSGAAAGGTRWAIGLTVLAPALAFTVLRAVINRLLTGSFADAGALVKLETLHPFHDSREMALRWLGHIGFQLTRITTYHTTDDPYYGWQIWTLALVGFFPERTRRVTLLLWVSALGWIAIVGQNEYVRYQNDRYTMPAVAWLLAAAAVGIGGAVDALVRQLRCGKQPIAALGAIVAVSVLCGSFLVHQLARVSQQRWLFGRACRNIAEQQIRVGQLLGAGRYGTKSRVLLGDAGAIPYFSGVPALDAIGLGGTQSLPFSRAVRLGVGATIELIEHLKPNDRPDIMAIYPSWWDLLPVWFGRPLEEVRIKGNVICGAANKGIYETDWLALNDSPRPLYKNPDTRVVDELDFADVLSETAHHYTLSSPHAGYVVMRLLPHPEHPRRDVFDAGRLAFSDTHLHFTLQGFEHGRPLALVFRAAPTDVSRFRVNINGHERGKIEMVGGQGWQEPTLEIPGRFVSGSVHVEIIPDGTEYTLYHLWATTPR